MTAPGPGPEDVVLLPTVSRDSDLHRALWRQLAAARDASGDPALRSVLDDVLSGRLPLRSALATPALSGLLERAGQQSREEWAALTPDQQEELRRRARSGPGGTA